MHLLLHRRVWEHVTQPCRHILRPVKLSFEKYGDEDYLGREVSPLVILHGLFGSKSNWQSIASALHQRLKTVIFALDLRNHG